MHTDPAVGPRKRASKASTDVVVHNRIRIRTGTRNPQARTTVTADYILTTGSTYEVAAGPIGDQYASASIACGDAANAKADPITRNAIASRTCARDDHAVAVVSADYVTR